MSNDNWRTPNWLYRWLEDLYGPFDIDLAASDQNTKCDQWYTVDQNALIYNWHERNKNGFCNPPYSRLPPWLQKQNSNKG